MACVCCNPPWNGGACECREPLDVRIIISAPYYVDPSFGVDPIANAIGTYVLSRDRAMDLPSNPNSIYYSLTPSGLSFLVDPFSFPSAVYNSRYDIPTGGVHALARVECGTLFIEGAYVQGVAIASASMNGKFIANRPAFSRFDVFNSNFTMPNPRPAAPCGTSDQKTQRLGVLDSFTQMTSGGATFPFPVSGSSFDNATVTLQLNG